MRVGFIGLGRMGAAMARNLLRGGHELKVFNRSRDKAEALGSAGAGVTASAAEAAQDVDAVYTMLADDAALAEVSESLLAAMDEKTVHIGSSTIGIELARRLAEEHGSRGQRYIAAPVFGRPDAAEAKRLVVVAAGDSATVEEVRPLLDAVGRQTFFAGTEPWHANAIKLSGNFMIASMIEAFSEAFATLRKAGVDPMQFLSVITEVFGSPVYTNYGKQIAERTYDTQAAGFALALGLKDVRLVSRFAEAVSAPMPLASLLKDHFTSAVANGQAALDWTSIAKVLERSAGLTQSA